MIQSNILQSLINYENLQHSKMVKFKAGQVFQGKVNKLYPNQTAAIQMGGLKLHAKLESGLTTNTNYWFQVQPNKEMVELKVIDSSVHDKQSVADHSTSLKQANQQLLAKFGIPKNKATQQLSEHLIKAQIPFTKEEILLAHSWLKEVTNQQKANISIQLMLEKGMPFTKEIFNSMMAVQEEKPLSQQLIDVKHMLQPLAKVNVTAQQLTNLVEKILNPPNEVAPQRLALSLLKSWLMSNNDADTESLLQKINLIPKGYTIENFKETINRFSPNGLLQLQGDEKAFLQLFFSRLENNANPNLTEKLIQAINKEMKVDNILQTIKELHSGQSTIPLSPKELATFKETTLFGMNDGGRIPKGIYSMQDLANTLKSNFNMLGLQFEHEILQHKDINFQQLQTLKPLLLSLIQQEGLNQVNKAEIQQLLHRLTGQQLVASDQNGPLQQILMQIPLQIGEKYTDLSIQWQGKQKKNGQIDPDFCRIIFYLDLEAINETVIDVQVQNRIINIQLVNGSPGIKRLVSGMESALKENLSEQNYKLSAISVIDNHARDHNLSSGVSASPIVNQSYTGVDFRV